MAPAMTNAAARMIRTCCPFFLIFRRMKANGRNRGKTREAEVEPSIVKMSVMGYDPSGADEEVAIFTMPFENEQLAPAGRFKHLTETAVAVLGFETE